MFRKHFLKMVHRRYAGRDSSSCIVKRPQFAVREDESCAAGLEIRPPFLRCIRRVETLFHALLRRILIEMDHCGCGRFRRPISVSNLGIGDAVSQHHSSQQTRHAHFTTADSASITPERFRDGSDGESPKEQRLIRSYFDLLPNQRLRQLHLRRLERRDGDVASVLCRCRGFCPCRLPMQTATPEIYRAGLRRLAGASRWARAQATRRCSRNPIRALSAWSAHRRPTCRERP